MNIEIDMIHAIQSRLKHSENPMYCNPRAQLQLKTSHSKAAPPSRGRWSSLTSQWEAMTAQKSITKWNVPSYNFLLTLASIAFAMTEKL